MLMLGSANGKGCLYLAHNMEDVRSNLQCHKGSATRKDAGWYTFYGGWGRRDDSHHSLDKSRKEETRKNVGIPGITLFVSKYLLKIQRKAPLVYWLEKCILSAATHRLQRSRTGEPFAESAVYIWRVYLEET